MLDWPEQRKTSPNNTSSSTAPSPALVEIVNVRDSADAAMYGNVNSQSPWMLALVRYA